MKQRRWSGYLAERAEGWDPEESEACYRSIVLARGSKRLGLLVLAMRGDPPVPWREVLAALLREIGQPPVRQTQTNGKGPPPRARPARSRRAEAARVS